MMDAHQLALERFQQGLQATEAAHEKQAAAERGLKEANLQLQEEREARSAAVSQLRDALGKEREEAERLRWEKEGCVARAAELERRVEELGGELLESQGVCAQQHGHFTEQIRALEVRWDVVCGCWWCCLKGCLRSGCLTSWVVLPDALLDRVSVAP